MVNTLFLYLLVENIANILLLAHWQEGTINMLFQKITYKGDKYFWFVYVSLHIAVLKSRSPKKSATAI
jgi:hypothetical protein